MPHPLQNRAGRGREAVGRRRTHRGCLRGFVLQGDRSGYLLRLHQQLLRLHGNDQTRGEAEERVRRLPEDAADQLARSAVAVRTDGEARSEVPPVHPAVTGRWSGL